MRSLDECRWPSAGGLDEGDLVDLAQRRDPRAYFSKRGLAQETHPLLAGDLADLGARFLVEDHLAHAVGQVEQFMDGGASAVPRAGALDAALSLVERHLVPLLRVQATRLELLIGVVHLLLAALADDAHQALRQDAIQRAHEVVSL